MSAWVASHLVRSENEWLRWSERGLGSEGFDIVGLSTTRGTTFDSSGIEHATALQHTCVFRINLIPLRVLSWRRAIAAFVEHRSARGRASYAPKVSIPLEGKVLLGDKIFASPDLANTGLSCGDQPIVSRLAQYGVPRVHSGLRSPISPTSRCNCSISTLRVSYSAILRLSKCTAMVALLSMPRGVSRYA